MHSPVIFIMGVSGSGKTTIGRELSSATGIPFFDGDDLHSPANIEKMREGQPLDDRDRASWLTRINELARKQATKNGAIIACSALKEKYRDILAAGLHSPPYWVMLQGEYSLIRERIISRKDHYMPASLLQSQLDTLEFPASALIVDINQEPAVIVSQIQKAYSLPAG